MPRLKPAKRDIGIDRLQAEQSQTEDCRQFNQSTFSRLRKRLSHTVSTQDLYRSGRPRITTPAQNRYIRIFYLRNRAVTAAGAKVYEKCLPGQSVSDFANTEFGHEDLILEQF
jgi:protein tyrosine/serine phosphatase